MNNHEINIAFVPILEQILNLTVFEQLHPALAQHIGVTAEFGLFLGSEAIEKLELQPCVSSETTPLIDGTSILCYQVVPPSKKSHVADVHVWLYDTQKPTQQAPSACRKYVGAINMNGELVLLKDQQVSEHTSLSQRILQYYATNPQAVLTTQAM